MKKIISLVVAMSFLIATMSSVVSASAINLPSNPAVIIKGDLTSGRTATIVGSVYSAQGNVKFEGGNSTIDGDLIYYESNKVIQPQNAIVSISGESKGIAETSFDYSLNDVTIPNGDASIFDNRNYNTIANAIIAPWMVAYANGLTISSDTHFTGALTLYNTLTVDTSKGDVYVKADSLLSHNDGSINVIGDGKLYLLVNIANYNSMNAVINAQVKNGTITRGNSNQVDLYLNPLGRQAAVGTNSNITATVYTLNTNDSVNFQFDGKIFGDIISKTSNLTIGNSGSTSVVGNIYATNAQSVTINQSVTGNVVTSAETFNIYSGAGNVTGVVFAPNANASIYSTGGLGIKGQLIASTLNIHSSGVVRYDQSIVDNFGLTATPTPTPTVEPTVEPTNAPTLAPTAEPTSVPTVEPTPEQTEFPKKDTALIPTNDIPSGGKITLKTDGAYLYGYTDDWVAADNPVTREEAAALINRLLVQNDKRGGFEKPNQSDYSDLEANNWSFSALEYMTSIGVYNPDDGTDQQRKISPNVSVTRGEVSKLVAFSLRLPYESGNIGFDDVSEDHPFYPYLKALVDEGLLQGNDRGLLNPDKTMTRAEFVTMFNRIIGRTEENGYIITEEDCPFLWNNIDQPFLPAGTIDENGNDVGHWAYYDVVLAANSFTNKKVDNEKKVDRTWLDKQ